MDPRKLTTTKYGKVERLINNLVRRLRRYRPHIVILTEVSNPQLLYKHLKRLTRRYDGFFVQNEPNAASPVMPLERAQSRGYRNGGPSKYLFVLWREDKFKMPKAPKMAPTYDGRRGRVCPVLLQHKQDGRRIQVLGMHVPFRKKTGEAKSWDASRRVKFVTEAYKDAAPSDDSVDVLLGGDFNVAVKKIGVADIQWCYSGTTAAIGWRTTSEAQLDYAVQPTNGELGFEHDVVQCTLRTPRRTDEAGPSGE